jgi:hypothetical protein
MPNMGRYCKAYPLNRVEEWPLWKAKMRPRIESAQADNDETSLEYVFIQENYTVTVGIFLDEEILFDDITPEWKEFCETNLGFQPPEPEQPVADAS